MAYIEFIVIFILILINGLLSLSETAVLSSRRSRLKSAAKNGQSGAQKALELAEDSSRFLSTVQVGITVIGVFLGIYAGITLSVDLSLILTEYDILSPYALPLTVLIAVLIITFFLIVFGELIPKKIAYSHPERIASIISRPMSWFSKLLFPVSWFVNGSANLIARIFGIKEYEPATTEEDVKAIVQEGLEGGTIDEAEQDLVERIFSLDDRKISSLVTHKNDIISIDVSAKPQELLSVIQESPFSVYPIVDKEIDNIIGVLQINDIVGLFNGPDFNIRGAVQPAYFLPENMTILSALENFRSFKMPYALITDEFGSIQGMVTISDIFEALVGDVTTPPSDEEYEIIKRNDNSWLVDGQFPFYNFLEYFELQDYYNEYPYNTLSGLILDKLGKMPHAGDKFDWLHFEIEVLDMDTARIDKVMVTEKDLSEPPAE
ncbi:MAG: hemolysin family protein [Methanimicrococcus sp.]|nr:hemolysin family protein [Methanimicrococcus sp.]